MIWKSLKNKKGRKSGQLKKNWYDWLIKETMVREKKPKIIRDKLRNEIIRDIWALFETGEENVKEKKA